MKKNHRVLLLGAGGLIGSAVAKKILSSGTNVLGLVSLKEKSAVERIDSITIPQNMEVHYYWKNIVGPKNLSDLSLGEMLSNESTRFELIKFLTASNQEAAKNSSVLELVKDFKPTIIVDCVNTATILSYYAHSLADTKDEQLCGTDFGLELLIQYFRNLSIIFEDEQINNNPRIEKYIKIGTTGVGGMGLDIPFTHGEERPSKELMRKVAFAGAQTMLLYALSNNRRGPLVKEIKPATAVFDEKIHYSDDSGKRGEVYTTLINLKNENEFNQISKYFRTNRQIKQSGYYLDGGESGRYSIQEFLLLTNRDLMGMTTAGEVAERIISEIEKDAGNDVINALKNNSVHPSESMQKIQNLIIDESREHAKDSPIAFGFLGPRKITKLLIEADMMLSLYCENVNLEGAEISFLSEIIQSKISKKGYKSMLSSLGIPVILPSDELIIYDAISMSKDSFSHDSLLDSRAWYEYYINNQWLDFRLPNLLIWTSRIKENINKGGNGEPFEIVKNVLTSKE